MGPCITYGIQGRPPKFISQRRLSLLFFRITCGLLFLKFSGSKLGAVGVLKRFTEKITQLVTNFLEKGWTLICTLYKAGNNPALIYQKKIWSFVICSNWFIFLVQGGIVKATYLQQSTTCHQAESSASLFLWMSSYSFLALFSGTF